MPRMMSGLSPVLIVRFCRLGAYRFPHGDKILFIIARNEAPRTKSQQYPYCLLI